MGYPGLPRTLFWKYEAARRMEEGWNQSGKSRAGKYRTALVIKLRKLNRKPRCLCLASMIKFILRINGKIE